LAHYILQPEMKNNVAESARIYLGYMMELPVKTRGKNEPSDPEAPVRRSAEEAATLLRLYPVLKDEIEKQGQTHLLEQIELPFAAVLARMEYTGVRIDPQVLYAMSGKLTARVEALEEEAYRLAGQQFNISSPSQVGEILFGKLKIDPKAKKTKTGAYSTTEEILEKLRAAHPLVGLILDIRGLRKLLATYVNSLPLLVDPHTGKIHTTYNQTATATGRISSTNPNLQNIPVRTDEGREIRKAFIPDNGCLRMAADYSQIELRLMAHLSQDPHMTEAFLSGEDIHRATAAKIHHIKPADVDDNQRRAAKTANFGIIYGISAFGLSQRLNISRAEAKNLIDGYFSA
ncbi:MAG: DNA polymerase I, partial [Muribaculaceae bacterium]|nr:DNA polymerase I [Muribaculaceae bacterium]